MEYQWNATCMCIWCRAYYPWCNCYYCMIIRDLFQSLANHIPPAQPFILSPATVPLAYQPPPPYSAQSTNQQPPSQQQQPSTTYQYQHQHYQYATYNQQLISPLPIIPTTVQQIIDSLPLPQLNLSGSGATSGNFNSSYMPNGPPPT